MHHYRRIPETAYLDQQNTPRYRAMLHYFYLQHGRLHYFLYPNEILEHMQGIAEHAAYTAEQLEADLKALVESGNLTPRQDASRVATISEFRNKKFRYQATPYTIEIERMVERLSDLANTSGGSLETTLFDRLLTALNKLTHHDPGDPKQPFQALKLPAQDINQLWEDLYNYFQTMGTNAADYLAHLKHANLEEQLKTDAFLIYKDAFITYLRKFMVGLQRSAARVAAMLGTTPTSFVDNLVQHLAAYQMTIPRLQKTPPTLEAFTRIYRERWQALVDWFLGTASHVSEWQMLQNETTEAIRQVARYAQRLGERLAHTHSRRRDYEHLAAWFANCDDLAHAHRLSAAVFGLQRVRHLRLDPSKEENPDHTIWQQTPMDLEIQPRTQGTRTRTRTAVGQIRRDQQQATRDAYLKAREAERDLVTHLLQRGQFDLSELGEVSPFIRKSILNWISQCFQSPNRTAKTNTGAVLKLRELDGRTTILIAPDGALHMPDMRFEAQGRTP